MGGIEELDRCERSGCLMTLTGACLSRAQGPGVGAEDGSSDGH